MKFDQIYFKNEKYFEPHRLSNDQQSKKRPKHNIWKNQPQHWMTKFVRQKSNLIKID